MKMKTNWKSHNELNAEPTIARIRRIKRHNALLGIAIAGMAGIAATLLTLIVIG